MPSPHYYQLRKLRSIAARYGLVLRPLDFGGMPTQHFLFDSSMRAQYDGDNRTLRTWGIGDRTATISDLTHELAHWLRASPERRHVPEFGLGVGPETAGKGDPPIVENPYDEEMHASMLGILIERELGANPMWTWEHHRWIDAQLGAAMQCLRELEGLGLARWTGSKYVPTCCLTTHRV